MTIAKFRTYKGCENYSDEEAAGIIESLRTLARILIEVQYNCSIDNLLISGTKQCSSTNIDDQIKQAA